jgi:perosamine synthetase
MIPLFKVFIAPEALKLIEPTLYSGYVGEGPKVKEFEQAFGKFIGNPNVAMVNSGTSALTLALRLAGVGPGDRVVTTPITCLATNMAISSLGAIPVWADVLPDGTIDKEDVLRKVRGCKAIMCVDVGGIPCEYQELRAIAENHCVFLISDACQALESTYKWDPVGSQAHMTCFSFQAIKYLTTVDGGAIAFSCEDDLIQDARLMRWFGLDREKSLAFRAEQDPPFWGYKMHMSDVTACIGLANLPHVQKLVFRTRCHAAQYEDAKIPCVSFDGNRYSNYWLYPILVENQKDFISYMAQFGIECSPVHCRNDAKSIYRGQADPNLPGVSFYDSHIVCIPVGWWLSQEDVHEVIFRIKGYKGGLINSNSRS